MPAAVNKFQSLFGITYWLDIPLKAEFEIEATLAAQVKNKFNE